MISCDQAKKLLVSGSSRLGHEAAGGLIKQGLEI
jgi:hypothetical protein